VNEREEALKRAEALGLAGRVRILARHFVDLPYQAYDAIASVGMFEHVGVARYPAYFGAVFRALKPGGLFLNQTISVRRGSGDRSGGAFIFRHVFPGAEIGDLPHVQAVMEDVGFELLDVQSLRPHYALTLREWSRRFRARRDEALRLVPERLVRIWEAYLAGAAQAFEDGIVSVHQVVAGRPRAG
jgi:cyclopropane-fatty-acyl-phospholipid synthase